MSEVGSVSKQYSGKHWTLHALVSATVLHVETISYHKGFLKQHSVKHPFHLQ